MCTHHLCVGQGRTVDVIGQARKVGGLDGLERKDKSGKLIAIESLPVDVVGPESRFGAKPKVARFVKDGHPFCGTRESFDQRVAIPARTRLVFDRIRAPWLV